MKPSEKYYNKLSSIYDSATKDEGMWNPPSYIFNYIEPYLNKKVNILDIGIGTGRSIEKIYKSKNYSSIHGVDISQSMLNVCKEKYSDIFLKKISDINELNLLDCKYDIIICSGTLEFIENLNDFFNQVFQLLEINGKLFFTYEVLIDFHPIQNKKKSLTTSSLSSKFFVEDFYTYRYKPFEIYKLLETYSFSLKNENEFIAYVKGEEKIIYHFLEVEKGIGLKYK